MSRKEHITRIFGRERGSDADLEDVYADVRRIDEIEFLDPGTGQGTVIEIAWEDGWNDTTPDDPDRQTTVLKVTDPENPPDDPEDPDQWIPIRIIDAAHVSGYIQGEILLTMLRSAPDQWQGTVLQFTNDKDKDIEELGREVRVVRVKFAETPGLDDRLSDGPIDFEDYQRDDDTKDDGQYVDIELIDAYNTKNRDQDIKVELSNNDDDLFNTFEEVGADPDKPPVRMDALQNIVNVKWESDVWALIWVSGTGLASVSQIVMRNYNGDPVGTECNIDTNAEILYERVDVITDDPAIAGETVGDTWNAQILYGSFHISDANSTYNWKVVDGLIISIPALFDPISGSYIGPFVNVYNADSPSDMSDFATAKADAIIAGTYIGDQTAVITTPKVEAIWLLEWKSAQAKKDRQFTITTDGWGPGIEVFLYPKSFLKVDENNKKYGFFGLNQEVDAIDPTSGRPATNPYQRVYFPINWKKTPPPYPKSPGGREWPWPYGNWMLTAPDPRDVINTAMFDIGCGFDGINPSWNFKVEKRNHWSSSPAPPIDPTLRDKMWQVWPTSVDPPIDEFTPNKWSVAKYTMKPFGEAFSAPDAWTPPSPDSPPSPLPKVAPEVAG